MNAQNEVLTSIEAIKVSMKKRNTFLYRHLGKQCINFEVHVYALMRQFSHQYDGGFWEFYQLNNGGFYMAPDFDESLHLFIPSNGYEGIMSCDAVGIVASLFALNHLCFLTKSKSIIEKYYLLLDFADSHAESAEIFAAID